MKYKVVVIGGGFAGLTVLKRLIRLKNIQLTLISENKNFLFTPRLTELLNESVQEKYIYTNLKKILHKNINFVNKKATSINLRKKFVIAGRKIDYDYLVISPGSRTNFFNDKSIEKNTIEFKDLNSISKINKRIDKIFKDSSSSQIKSQLFTVIGAGPTGVELIISLKETVLKKFKNSRLKPRFLLIHGQKDILPQFPKKVRDKVIRCLTSNKIEIMAGTRANKIKKNQIITATKTIKSSLILWTAGITANKIKTSPLLNLENGFRIKVTSKLKIPGYNDVYIGGDSSYFIENKKPIPQTAQNAMSQGKIIAENICRRLKGKIELDYKYKNLGTLIVLGHKNGTYNSNSIILIGKLIWYFRNLAYKIRFKQLTKF